MVDNLMWFWVKLSYSLVCDVFGLCGIYECRGHGSRSNPNPTPAGYWIPLRVLGRYGVHYSLNFVSIIVIRWLLSLYLTGPTKIRSYTPSDFYDNSDVDSDNETAKYSEHKSKLRVIRASSGQKKVKQSEAKHIMIVTTKDL